MKPVRRFARHPVLLSQALAWALVGPLHLCSAAAIHNESISINGPAGKINGILELPSSGRPSFVGLLVVGSGPTDLDGNNPLGVTGSPYRALAELLVVQGAAVARFDKRGIASSAQAILDPNFVTIQDYANDVSDFSRFLVAKTRVSCIWLIGHSEGGVVALTAAQGDAPICGLVLIATPGRPLGDVLQEQIRRQTNDDYVLSALAEAIANLKAGKSVHETDLPVAIQGLFYAGTQHFLADFLNIDPVVLMRRVRVPVLIIQGSNDLQVSSRDAQRLSAANRAAVLRLVPHMNHVFRDTPDGDEQKNLQAYSSESATDPALATSISDFALHHKARR